MSRPQTPIPEPARRLVRVVRLSIIPVGVLALFTAVLALVAGLPGLALVIAVSASLFGLTLWLTPQRLSILPGVAAIGLITWYVRGVLSTGVLAFIIGLAVVSVAVPLFGWNRLPRSLTPESIKRTADDAIGVGAERFVREFEELGYRQVGALTFRTMGFDVIESLMIGPNRDRFAEVTDAVVNVVSHFGDRSLMTRNSGMTSVPPYALVSDLRGAEPRELDTAHDRALSEVSTRARPDRIDPETLVDRAIHEERQAIIWMRSRASKVIASRSGLGTGPLWERGDRDEAISIWLTNGDPTSFV